MNRGLIAGFLAYLSWGFLPIYWKYLSHVPPQETLAHRIVWTVVLLVALLSFQKQWGWLRPALQDARTLLSFIAAAVLLSINWGLYIWAVNNGFIAEASLGYFINPLLNVLLGYLFFGERPRPVQRVAIGLAALGVAYLTFVQGQPPILALTLAFSFATYGLLKKRTGLKSAESLAFETMLVVPVAIIYLLFLAQNGTGNFAGPSLQTTLLIPLSGFATALPLIAFTYAAQRITLTTLGILQYIAPTIQFLLGVFVYNEAFDQTRLIGFVFIWLALIIYATESVTRHRREQAAKLSTA